LSVYVQLQHAKSLNGGWQVFEPFGPVELVQLPADPETGQCKGFGFVQVRCMFVFSASVKHCSTPEVPQLILYVAIVFYLLQCLLGLLSPV
jgi:hypothetical protein